MVRRRASIRFGLAALLLHLAQRLGQSNCPEGPRIPIRLSHKALADLTGCHRSTVTTQLNEWMYEGVLTQTEGLLCLVREDVLGQLSPGNATAIR